VTQALWLYGRRAFHDDTGAPTGYAIIPDDQ